jgi:hypothetical protein
MARLGRNMSVGMNIRDLFKVAQERAHVPLRPLVAFQPIRNFQTTRNIFMLQFQSKWLPVGKQVHRDSPQHIPHSAHHVLAPLKILTIHFGAKTPRATKTRIAPAYGPLKYRPGIGGSFDQRSSSLVPGHSHRTSIKISPSTNH